MDPMSAYRGILRKRMLTYGFVVSVIGLPIGIVLQLPVVWILSLLGIAVGGIGLLFRRKEHSWA